MITLNALSFCRPSGQFILARAFKFDQMRVILSENFIVQRDLLPGTGKVEEKLARFCIRRLFRQQRAFGDASPGFLNDVGHGPSRIGTLAGNNRHGKKFGRNCES